VAEACECGNETSGSVKFREYFEWLQFQLASHKDLCAME